MAFGFGSMNSAVPEHAVHNTCKEAGCNHRAWPASCGGSSTATTSSTSESSCPLQEVDIYIYIVYSYYNFCYTVYTIYRLYTYIIYSILYYILDTTTKHLYILQSTISQPPIQPAGVGGNGHSMIYCWVIYVYVDMYICIYIYIYIYIYVCVYIVIYICIYTHRPLRGLHFK